jgi:hypothetical protein
VAAVQVAAPSKLTSTTSTPPSAHAHPQIAVDSPAATVASGPGETITDSGAIDQTGVVAPVGFPDSSRIGSLYQRVVKGPVARASARVIRVSHFTLFVP